MLPPTDKYVMVVDDDDATREAFALILSLHGYRVQTASDGFHALEQLRTERPHLIVLDLMMPVMDGAQLSQRLSEDEQLATIPLLLCTASGRTATSLPIRPVGTLIKPIEVGDLLDAVDRHC